MLRKSIASQVLWPIVVWFALVCALTASQSHRRRELARSFANATEQRIKVERAVLHLRERHDRTMRRMRDALLDSRPEGRLGILARTSEHYSQQMEHHLNELENALEAAGGADIGGLGQAFAGHLDRIYDEINRIVLTIENLVDAVASDEPDLVLYASQELQRADRTMHTMMIRLEALTRQAGTLRLQTRYQNRTSTTDILWVLFLVWSPAAVILCYLPLRRIAKVLQTPEGPLPNGLVTPAELGLHTTVKRLQNELVTLESQLGDQSRQTEKAQQAVLRVERELALLKLYSDNLVNSLSTAIVVTNATGEITNFNRAARQLLPLDEQAIGQPIAQHPLFGAVEQRLGDARHPLELALTQRRAIALENVTLARHEKELVLDVTIAPYLDESGAGRGLLWVADDVTEAVRTKNQLLAAERLAAVGRLSAQVAHEIRNPLSAIGLNAELLEEDFAPALPESSRQEAVELLAAISSEVERLTQVTESYLQLARPPKPQVQPTDVNQVLTDLLTMLNEEFKSHRIQVQLDLGAPPPHALTDAGQLRQALLNITRNSREAMPEGGTLHMSTGQTAHTAWVRIADTGTGIDDHLTNRIFEPFYSTKPDGTGLGLSLTQQIIREHGGSIEVASARQQGTTVTIRLPAHLGDHLTHSATG